MRTRTKQRAFLLAVTVLSAALPSLAQPLCQAQDVRAMPRHLPISLGFEAADFATTPSACPWTGVLLDARGSLLIDRPNFYGYVQAEGTLTGAFAPRVSEPLAWFTFSLSAVNFRFSQNASLIATELALGGSTAAVHLRVFHRNLPNGNRIRLSAFARLLLPTDLGYSYALRTGIEPGLVLYYTPNPRVSLHAGVTLPLAVTYAGNQGTHLRFLPRVSTDLLWSALEWLEFGVGLEARVGIGSNEAGFDYFAPKASVRFAAPRQGFYSHLTALVPLLGTERALVRFAVGAGAVF